MRIARGAVGKALYTKVIFVASAMGASDPHLQGILSVASSEMGYPTVPSGPWPGAIRSQEQFKTPVGPRPRVPRVPNGARCENKALHLPLK
jgi:hypothetical protein